MALATMDTYSHSGPAGEPPHGRDPDDPRWKAVELAQRGRLILDVAAADLEVAEAKLGSFHETTWFFRNALDEAKRSWNRLRAELGGAALAAALEELPLAILMLGEGEPGKSGVAVLVISGKTYRVEPIAGTAPAPVIWRLARLPAHDDGPYYACRLQDGSIQCDCAEWTFGDALNGPATCKHLRALSSLGWM